MIVGWRAGLKLPLAVLGRRSLLGIEGTPKGNTGLLGRGMLKAFSNQPQPLSPLLSFSSLSSSLPNRFAFGSPFSSPSRSFSSAFLSEEKMFEEADETPEIETDTKADQEPQQEKEEEEEEVKVVVFVPPPGVTIVRDVETAKQVVSELRQLSGPNYFHACDTEVMDLDLNIEGPVGHGKCTCVSIYVGPDLDFGNGPRIWIGSSSSFFLVFLSFSLSLS